MLNKKANAGAWIGGGLGALGGYTYDTGKKKDSMSDKIKRTAVGGLGGAALGGFAHANIKNTFKNTSRKSSSAGKNHGSEYTWKKSNAGGSYKGSSGSSSGYKSSGSNSEHKSSGSTGNRKSNYEDIKEKFRKAQEEAKRKAEEQFKKSQENTGSHSSSNKGGADNSTYNKAKNKFTSEFDGMSGVEAKRHYRQSARKNHPDMGGNEEDFKGLSSAYEAFKKRNNL